MNRTYQTYKPHKTYSYLTRRRAMIEISLLPLASLGYAIATLSLGSEHVNSRSLFPDQISKLTGAVSTLSSEQDVIIFSLRLPRIALAIGVGAALAVAGSAFQALLRHPLADPYVLGVSGGAALGSIIAIIFVSELSYSRPLFGFAGAAIAT